MNNSSTRRWNKTVYLRFVSIKLFVGQSNLVKVSTLKIKEWPRLIDLVAQVDAPTKWDTRTTLVTSLVPRNELKMVKEETTSKLSMRVNIISILQPNWRRFLRRTSLSKKRWKIVSNTWKRCRVYATKSSTSSARWPTYGTNRRAMRASWPETSLVYNSLKSEKSENRTRKET